MLRAVCLAGVVAIAPIAGLAETTPDVPTEAQMPHGSTLAAEDPELFALFHAMGLYDILEIMSIEGVDYAGDLEAEMFPGQGGPAWQALVGQIYGLDRITTQFESALPEEVFSDDHMAELAAFFASETGQRIVEGEILARREIMDPTVEEAANIIYREERAAESPRLQLLDEFVTANAMIDLNVSGALNSNFAFYRGLVDGGAFDVELPEDVMLAEVWGQEPELREETTLWLYSYQLMAYDDLTDEELRAYIALSETPAGQRLNRVLFSTFDAMFEAVSYNLGTAAAVFIAGDET